MSIETVHTFDFGFTTVNLEELETFQEQKQEMNAAVDETAVAVDKDATLVTNVWRS